MDILHRFLLPFFKRRKKQTETKEPLKNTTTPPQEHTPEENLNYPQPGEIFWCLMPLKKEQLEKIEESHRVRPYLIERVENHQIHAYYCSSSPIRRIPHNEQYIIKKDQFYCHRDTYVNLHTTYTIPFENLRSFYFAIDRQTFHLIQEQRRHCVIASSSPPSTEVKEGCVLRDQGQLYLIYQCDHSHLYGTRLREYQPFSEVRKEDILTCLFNRIYLVNFNASRMFRKTAPCHVFTVCSQEQLQYILTARKQQKLMKSKQQQKPDHPHIIDEAYYAYTPGTMLSFPPDAIYLYLFSFKGKSYGIHMDHLRGDNLNIIKLDPYPAKELALCPKYVYEDVLKRVNCHPPFDCILAFLQEEYEKMELAGENIFA